MVGLSCWQVSEDELAKDPAVQIVLHYTEEGKKVAKLGWVQTEKPSVPLSPSCYCHPSTRNSTRGQTGPNVVGGAIVSRAVDFASTATRTRSLH